MITFNYETDFQLTDEAVFEKWVSSVIGTEGKKEGEINYIFCDDQYLHKINLEYLNHDDYTDIISFDYSVGNELHGDIFISIERVRENADTYDVEFFSELKRVMIHGVLHYCGYKDKSDDDAVMMRKKEEEMMALLPT